MSAPQVVGLGTPVSDYIVRIDRMPTPNGYARASAHSWQQGGKASTAMAALGRLGVPCAFVGVVGADVEGEMHRLDLRFNGVDDSHVVVDPSVRTAYNVILADRETGGRAIIGGGRTTRGLRADDLDEAVVRGARVLLVESGGEAAEAAVGWIHASGGLAVADADWFHASLEALLPSLDVVILSEDYARDRSPGLSPIEACREIARLGPRTVVLTLGAKGCVGVAPEGEFECPTFPVPVVDTTGAGDVFHGAYCYGLVQGWTARECCVWASATASVKCMAIGGRAGLPTAGVVQRFLSTGEVDPGFLEERTRHYEIPYHQAGTATSEGERPT
jgi:sugar/nucleoside kinase (ribokinase family)